MAGRSRTGNVGAVRRALIAVDAEVAPGETLRARTVLRGAGPTGVDGDAWVLAVTDRRVLLFALGTGRQPAVLATGAPAGDVRVLDAQLHGATPALVLLFPDAEIARFTPVSAWRRETAAVVEVLRLAAGDSGAEPYPSDCSAGSGTRAAVPWE